MILGVEYAGESDAEVRSKVEALEALRAKHRFGYGAHITSDPVSRRRSGSCAKRASACSWALRRMLNLSPLSIIWRLIRNTCRSLVPRFREIMAKHGADGAYYGHCSVGCLHIRPIINLKTKASLEQVKAIADEITGSGDGIRRGNLERTRRRSRPQPVS